MVTVPHCSAISPFWTKIVGFFFALVVVEVVIKILHIVGTNIEEEKKNKNGNNKKLNWINYPVIKYRTQHVPLEHSRWLLLLYCFINNYLITSPYIMLQHMKNCSINSKWKAWQFFSPFFLRMAFVSSARLIQRDLTRARTAAIFFLHHFHSITFFPSVFYSSDNKNLKNRHYVCCCYTMFCGHTNFNSFWRMNIDIYVFRLLFFPDLMFIVQQPLQRLVASLKSCVLWNFR